MLIRLCTKSTKTQNKRIFHGLVKLTYLCVHTFYLVIYPIILKNTFKVTKSHKSHSYLKTYVTFQLTFKLSS